MKHKEMEPTDNDLIVIIRRELVYYANSITKIYNSKDMLDIDSFIARSLKKIISLIDSIWLIVNQKDLDIGSALTLTRSLAENVSNLRLLAFSDEEQDVKQLRYYLYLLDGISSKIKANQKILNVGEINDEQRLLTNKYISENTEFVNLLEARAFNIANKHSEKTGKIIKGSIVSKNRYRWRFNDIQAYKAESIESLLIKTYGNNAGIMIQSLLSQFVHGLLDSDINFQTPYFNKEKVSIILLASCKILIEGIKSTYNNILIEKDLLIPSEDFVVRYAEEIFMQRKFEQG